MSWFERLVTHVEVEHKLIHLGYARYGCLCGAFVKPVKYFYIHQAACGVTKANLERQPSIVECRRSECEAKGCADLRRRQSK